ncbi:hypothetical protein LY76DRAFT_29079 [Colletotrichum caudatum]|nr:hypothetical protein LY76DRAFT_29079 [Colletotrichum caudatum]
MVRTGQRDVGASAVYVLCFVAGRVGSVSKWAGRADGVATRSQRLRRQGFFRWRCAQLGAVSCKSRRGYPEQLVEIPQLAGRMTTPPVRPCARHPSHGGAGGRATKSEALVPEAIRPDRPPGTVPRCTF